MRPWKVIDLISSTTKYFQKLQISNPRLDAELLLAHILNLSRINLYVNFDQIVEPQQLELYRELVKKRASRIPVNHLINLREFMSLEFYVDSNVLIPRPETEVLVETALKLSSNDDRAQRVLEIGVGSGAISVSLALEKKSWSITATDISYQALKVAKKNAERHQVLSRLSLICADLFSPIKDDGGRFDWILSNPPYIPSLEIQNLIPEIKHHEPKIAIDGGLDGLDFIRKLISQAPKFLKVRGKLLFEVGSGQSGQVKKLIDDTHRYAGCFIVKDYAGIERVVVAETR